MLRRRLMMLLGQEEEEMADWKLLKEVTIETDTNRIDIENLNCSELLVLCELKADVSCTPTYLLNTGWSTSDPYILGAATPTDYYKQDIIRAFAKNGYGMMDSRLNAINSFKYKKGTKFSEIQSFSVVASNNANFVSGSKIAIFGR